MEEYENFDAMQEAARRLVEQWEREENGTPPDSRPEGEDRPDTQEEQ